MLATFGRVRCLYRLCRRKPLLPSAVLHHPRLLLLLHRFQVHEGLAVGCNTSLLLEGLPIANLKMLHQRLLGMLSLLGALSLLSLLGMLWPVWLAPVSKGPALQVQDLCCCMKLILGGPLRALPYP